MLESDKTRWTSFDQVGLQQEIRSAAATTCAAAIIQGRFRQR